MDEQFENEFGIKEWKPEYFKCQCHSQEHTLVFEIDREDGYDICAYVFLNDWQEWYKRLWVAIKYIFGYKCKHGHWDAFLMHSKDYDRFRKMLELSEEYNKYCEKERKELEEKFGKFE